MDRQMLTPYVLRRWRKRRHVPSRLPLWILRLGIALGTVFVLSVLFVIGTTAAGAYTAYAALNQFVGTLPAPEAVRLQATQNAFKTVKLYDRTGQTLLYQFHDALAGNHIPIPLSQIPDNVKNATIAVEDKTFYSNPGFDVRGIARAFVDNFSGAHIQGGSSITQQLVKNVIIPQSLRTELSYQRKVEELVVSWQLSQRYSGRKGKDQILEWYLNTIFYGNNSYGIEAAANRYFGKKAADLTLAEAAMLVPIPEYPAINPLNTAMLDEAISRRNVALDEMQQQGYITADQAAQAKQEGYTPPPPKQDEEQGPLAAPHFANYVRQLLETQYGQDAMYKGGYKVITSIDLNLQTQAEDIARAQIADLVKRGKNAHNAAVVAIDPRTGEILAMVGSVDYNDPSIAGQVNVALSPRQPGSSFKVYTYTEAFLHGLTPASMIVDAPIAFKNQWETYKPVNYDGKFHGTMTLRTALANSFNIPAVKLINQFGVQNVLDLAHKMGITTLNSGSYGLSLTLGGGEVTLLDHTYAYSVFANGGVMIGQPVPPEWQRAGMRTLDPVAILKIEDSDGNVVMSYDHPQSQRIIPETVAYEITSILSDNKARQLEFGPNSVLQISREAAVKTGTTNDWKDNWTMGYTPQIALGVWVGNSDNKPMVNIIGIDGAGPIWHKVMEAALKDQPVMAFVAPPGLPPQVASKLPDATGSALAASVPATGKSKTGSAVAQPVSTPAAPGKPPKPGKTG